MPLSNEEKKSSQFVTTGVGRMKDLMYQCQEVGKLVEN